MKVRPLSVYSLIVLVSIFCLLALNSFFFDRLPTMAGDDAEAPLFRAALCVVVVALFNMTLGLLAVGRATKFVLVAFLLIAAASDYFMKTYSVLINMEMIRNTFETTWEESNQFFTFNMVVAIALKGVLPALLIWWIPLKPDSDRALRSRALFFGLNGALCVLVLLPFLQSTILLFRNHREIRLMVNPLSSIYATIQYGKTFLPHREKSFVDFPLQSASPLVSEAQTRKIFSIFVVGETARANHFSLNGYARETNPELSKLPVLNYPDTTSCNTDTATSMPCMFSHLGRANFSVSSAKRFSNALDILSKAGFSTYWVDNNTGCKGICSRVINLPIERIAELCNSGGCFDEVVFPIVDRLLAENTKTNTFLVLHQLGSHGPAYYLRYPDRFRRFTPTCDSVDLQECESEALINTYDNTILYTDYFLAELIRKLAAHGSTYDTSLMYASDHGESLGEHNLYLHGLPYFVAPKEQTHVPFVVWLSEQMQARLGVDMNCLQAERAEPRSHDNLFHSVLGMYGVDVEPYKRELDIFSSCRVGDNPRF